MSTSVFFESCTSVTVFTVEAHAESGEWYGQPVASDEMMTWADWYLLDDTDAVHYDQIDAGAHGIDTYGCSISGGNIPLRVEWRAA